MLFLKTLVCGWGLKSDQRSAPSLLLGLRLGMCGYLPFSLGQESLGIGAGPFQGSLHSARPVAPLWRGSGQGHIGGG